MIIDFTEIPKANKGGGQQDTFELFARDFLQEIGFEIIRHPDRGPDGKKDMIVRETRNGVGGKTTIDWLVSCKHNAHSKKSEAVKDTDEPNVTERLTANCCQGFIGIYSTIATPSLSNMLFGCKDKFEHQIYDHKRIEKLILEKKERHLLFKRYFTSSYEKHKHLFVDSKTSSKKKKTESQPLNLTEEDFFRISKTAIIIIELEKIKEKYFNSNWEKKGEILEELNKYSNHSNLIISEAVFDFLLSVANQTSIGMTSDIAISVFSLSLDFFPYFEDNKDEEKVIEIGNQCANIAFNMIHDTMIYMKDYSIAMYGLTILKYIYKRGKHEKLKVLVDKVNQTYEEIELALQQSERKDLENALELVQIFKSDIEKGNLTFPYLPENLHKIIYPGQ